MRNLFIVLCVLCFSGVVSADEIILHTVSHHTTSSRKTESSPGSLSYNNSNFGLGYRWDSGWSTGLYYNSYSRPTVYVSHDWMLLQNFGAFASIATGYDTVAKSPITIVGGLVIKVAVSDTYSMNILLVPPSNKKVDGVVHLAILKRL